jgi:hypothetical protein
MTSRILARAFLCLASFALALPSAPLRAQTSGPATLSHEIVAEFPLDVVAEEGGIHGQLPVAREVTGTDPRAEFTYTITAEPQHGRVGLAGAGETNDFFATKTSRLGYYAYRANEGFSGFDSFGYTVRNETTGLVYRATVRIEVKPATPLQLDEFAVTADRLPLFNVREVLLSTRPNRPVIEQLPSHEAFMPAADREAIRDARVAFALDDSARPQHGTAKLDRATGRLSYAPDPGFIGQDRFRYYTVDENNPHLGVENAVVVTVEPLRTEKRIAVDRSRSREVDLVFVINNSPSMAPHQARIAENLSRFRQLFHTHDLDYRIGVLTTDFVTVDPHRRPENQRLYTEVRSIEFDREGNPVPDRRGRPKQVTKQVASNGNLVTLPPMDQPWVTPRTPDAVFAELVKVGTRGNSNRTAFTSVYNFVAGYHNGQHAMLRPEATTIVVFFMDEEETRMAVWREGPQGARTAEWVESGKLPQLLAEYNARHPDNRQTLDGYINSWVLRPFIIAKGNKRGKLEIHAVVAPGNISHRRAAELTGGTVLNIEQDFSAPLAALGDRIAGTVAVALEPLATGATLYRKSIRVLVDGTEVRADPLDGWVYDERSHSIRFHGAAKDKAFLAKIEITYEEHL